MEPDSNKTMEIIFAVVVILVVIIGGYYLYKTYSAPQEENIQEQIAEQTDINPIENLPETNPFEAETNPFSGGYKNPFGN